MTLGEWLDTWLELYVYPNRLAPSTKACYNRAVRGLPASLVGTDLQELSALGVRRCLLQIASEHPRAAQLDRHVLLRALRVAEKAGLAPPGLSDPELLPEIVHQPRKAPVLDSDQMRAYMAAAAKTAAAPVLLRTSPR